MNDGNINLDIDAALVGNRSANRSPEAARMPPESDR